MQMDWLQVALGALGGGGLAGTIVAVIKAGREAARISVSAAEGAVVVQKEVVETLREEGVRLREELREVHTRCDRLVALLREARGLEPKEPFP